MAESAFLNRITRFLSFKSRYIKNVPKGSHPNPTCAIAQGNVQGRGYGFTASILVDR